MKIDLNCDMGEGFGVYKLGDDAAMLDIVSSANIACGFHAGDPIVMHETLRLAREKGVQAGAHPSFLDIWGFGRRPIHGESPADIEKQVIYQIGALQALGESVGCPIRHVKTHGSLGNMAAEDADLATAVARAIKSVDPDLIFLVMPGMETEKAGEKLGLPLAREIYADRAYGENGNLLSRKLAGAVIHDGEAAADSALRMVLDQEILTASGRRIKAKIDSVCVHGDTPGAVGMARILRDRLVSAGLEIGSMADVIGIGQQKSTGEECGASRSPR